MSQSLELSVRRPTSRHESRLYSKSSFSFSLFHASAINPPSFSSFSRAHPSVVTVAFSLFLYSLPDLLYSRADYSCVHREVCVIGKAGKGTSIEKGRCFWSCIVLRVASDREYPTYTVGVYLYLLLRIVRS